MLKPRRGFRLPVGSWAAPWETWPWIDARDLWVGGGRRCSRSELDGSTGFPYIGSLVEFGWDEEKAVENLRKHGVGFPQATLAFRDTVAVDLLDDREDYGEDRFIHIGSSAGQVLTVACTERGSDRIRIISARRATKDEQEYYYSQSSY